VDEVEFGRYRLISLISEGDMGKVFRALDPQSDREVAIKVLPTELANEPGYSSHPRATNGPFQALDDAVRAGVWFHDIVGSCLAT
jgi:serine/threonine protein kinase